MMNMTAVTMTVMIVVMTAAATVTVIINIMVATIVVIMAVTWAGTKTGNVKHRIKHSQIKEHLRVLFVYLTTTLKKDTVSFLLNAAAYHFGFKRMCGWYSSTMLDRYLVSFLNQHLIQNDQNIE